MAPVGGIVVRGVAGTWHNWCVCVRGLRPRPRPYKLADLRRLNLTYKTVFGVFGLLVFSSFVFCGPCGLCLCRLLMLPVTHSLLLLSSHTSECCKLKASDKIRQSSAVCIDYPDETLGLANLVAKVHWLRRPLKSHYKSTAHTSHACFSGGGAMRQVPGIIAEWQSKGSDRTREVPCPKDQSREPRAGAESRKPASFGFPLCRTGSRRHVWVGITPQPLWLSMLP